MTSASRPWPPLVASFTAVLILKAVLLVAWGNPPPLHDEVGYLAASDAALEWLGDRELRASGHAELGRLAWHNPGYSAIFPVLGLVLGSPAPALRVLQSLAGLLAGLVLFHALRRRVPRTWALAGAALLWLHPSMLFFGLTLWPVALATLLTASLALCALRLAEQPDRPDRQWAFGIVLAPLPFFAAPALALLPGLLVWPGPGRLPRTLGPSLALWIPWLLLASSNLGIFTPMGLSGPRDLALGHHPAIAQDRGSLWGDPEGKAALQADLDAVCRGARGSLPDRVRCEALAARDIAWENIRSEPGMAVARGLRKLEETWRSDRFLLRHLEELGRPPPGWLATLLIGLHALILLAALAGLSCPEGRSAALAVALWCVPVLVTVGFTRLRQPLLPWLIVAAECGWIAILRDPWRPTRTNEQRDAQTDSPIPRLDPGGRTEKTSTS